MIKGHEKILIIKLSSIGDVVHTLPFVEVLKANYPEITIDWCVDEEISSILSHNPYLNRLIISKRNTWKTYMFHPMKWYDIIKELFLLIKELRELEYDIIIDLQGLLKSALIAGASKGKIKIGLDGAREYGWLFVDEIVPVDYNQHAIDRYLQIATYLGCPFLDWKWRLFIPDEDKEKVNNIISFVNKDNLPIIGINPCARWKTKLWQIDKFSKLARGLIQSGLKPIFIGGEKDKKYIDSILAEANGAINMAGIFNLNQLSYFYSRCHAVISVDTGPMHIAVMAGCKVVAIFGPTDPNRTGPYGSNHIIIKSDISCSPCFKKKCDHIKCMNDIDASTVLHSTIKILNNRR